MLDARNRDHLGFTLGGFDRSGQCIDREFKILKNGFNLSELSYDRAALIPSFRGCVKVCTSIYREDIKAFNFRG